MPEKMPDFFVMVLYAIAAVSGGMGGCASGLYYFTHSRRHTSASFICAYTILGVVFGVVTLAMLYFWHRAPASIHELILFSIIGGSAGSVALATANWTIKAIFRRFGLEVQVTLRPADESKSESGDWASSKRSSG